MSEFYNSSYLFASNSVYVEELYQRFLQDPNSVDSEWNRFFSKIVEDKKIVNKDLNAPSWKKNKTKVLGVENFELASSKDQKNKDKFISVSEEKDFSLNIEAMIDAFRQNGHLLTDLDPLGLEVIFQAEDIHLDPLFFGFKESDLNKETKLEKAWLGRNTITISNLVYMLKSIYCNKIGFEVAHLHSTIQKDWLYEQIESLYDAPAFTNKKKLETLNTLIEVETFERFLHSRFPGAKRFSIEGGESAIVAIDELIKTSAIETNVKEVLIGMAHRGRLNVLTKIMGKSYSSMISEFMGNLAHTEDLGVMGDVKYHLGLSRDYVVEGRNVHFSLAANPSHLEAVNPVVAGKVRAKQDSYKDIDRTQVIGLMIHGDASFAGQGVVAETLGLSDLDGYCTGGTLHVIINNQIGFTTSPSKARKSRYPTEVAKIIQAPIIHVNGDEPEAVIRACHIAEKFRSKFKKDVVIDIVCYRLHGHNEGDEPSYTQPIMYKRIKEHKNITNLYTEKLVSEGVVTAKESEEIIDKFYKFLDNQYELSKSYKPAKNDWLEGKWKNFKYQAESDFSKDDETGIAIDKLKKLGKAICTYPSDLQIHPKLAKLLETKIEACESGKNIDWATAELMAYGSLLIEGIPVRLSGQDSGRGTFSHRHSVLLDQHSENKFIPLNNIQKDQARYEVIDSSLSEYGVLGFEYGYSLVDPRTLTIWEAQFGDFVNGAQIIIDQFISSSEEKWLRMSGLVMLLPHGYEGMGPEHTSARLERFLQLCGDNNMQVVNCTTPANFFHVLRRQIVRNFRKPLIVMSPKSLFRHKLVVSDFVEMEEKTSFKMVIGEVTNIDAQNVKKVIICSGKVYYDLFEEREKRNIKDISLIRLEQYYPFPAPILAEELKKYPNAQVVWCQEEPKNMGAWNFVYTYLKELLKSLGRKDVEPNYIGREVSASPAAGYAKVHNQQQAKLIQDALF